mmetsp:Transcript_103781/g.332549  ORF Transcript_103781/g.332549 Transcript_103781/m.332549 type:complete len:294 (+) Transcript_103781:883-1764(+)
MSMVQLFRCVLPPRGQRHEIFPRRSSVRFVAGWLLSDCVDRRALAPRLPADRPMRGRRELLRRARRRDEDALGVVVVSCILCCDGWLLLRAARRLPIFLGHRAGLSCACRWRRAAPCWHQRLHQRDAASRSPRRVGDLGCAIAVLCTGRHHPRRSARSLGGACAGRCGDRWQDIIIEEPTGAICLTCCCRCHWKPICGGLRNVGPGLGRRGPVVLDLGLLGDCREAACMFGGWCGGLVRCGVSAGGTHESQPAAVLHRECGQRLVDGGGGRVSGPGLHGAGPVPRQSRRRAAA